MAKVVEDLVPEPGVQQVQRRVFDATHIQVHPARIPPVSRAHPVPLHLRVAEGRFVDRVKITQLVPARTGPLGHHIQLPPVTSRALAQVELNYDPVRPAPAVASAPRSRHRDPRPRPEIGQVRQLHGKFGRRARPAGARPRRRRPGTAHPLTLPREQPVPQLVCHRRLAGVVLRQPAGDRCLAAATSNPSRSPELIAGPSPVKARPSKPSGGRTVRTIGGVGQRLGQTSSVPGKTSAFRGYRRTHTRESVFFQRGINRSVDIGVEGAPNPSVDTWRGMDADRDVSQCCRPVARPVPPCPVRLRLRGHDRIPPLCSNPVRIATVSTVVGRRRASVLIRCSISLRPYQSNGNHDLRLAIGRTRSLGQRMRAISRIIG